MTSASDNADSVAYKIFRACEEGNLDWLKQQYETGGLGDSYHEINENLSEATSYSDCLNIMELAAAKGHLHIVKWFVEISDLWCQRTCLSNGDTHQYSAGDWFKVAYVAGQAAASGQQHIISWLLAHTACSDDGPAASVFYREVIKNAVENGLLNIVKWLVAQVGGDESLPHSNAKVLLTYALQSAAEHGDLEIYKKMCQFSQEFLQNTTEDEDINYASFPHPCAIGSSHLVPLFDSKILRDAAYSGHLHIVQWLINESGLDVDVDALDKEVVKNAAIEGHLNVVKWIVEESGQDIDVTDDYFWNENIANVESRKYLQEIKDLQLTAGDKWKEALKALRQHLPRPRRHV